MVLRPWEPAGLEGDTGLAAQSAAGVTVALADADRVADRVAHRGAVGRPADSGVGGHCLPDGPRGRGSKPAEDALLADFAVSRGVAMPGGIREGSEFRTHDPAVAGGTVCDGAPRVIRG